MTRSTGAAKDPLRSDLVERRLRVLLVPDSIHWITGTIARSIALHNPSIDATVISGPVLDNIALENAEVFDAFDLVHFVCPYASRKWLPELRERVPCVTSHHHVSDRYELLAHNLNGDALIVGSMQWAEDAIQRGAAPDRVICVPYGVDASRFAPTTAQARSRIRGSLGIASSAIVVGFFAKKSSNERDRKGTDVFSAALKELSRRVRELCVLIIGPGWNELVSHLTEAGLTVVWIPFVKEASRMPEMYQALDFYWVTARVEGGPVTLLEAMSSGVCCVTTWVGLAREVVEHRVSGVVVPFEDPHAFARETAEYAENRSDRDAMGVKAREAILQTMDVPITSKGVHKAYDAAQSWFRARTKRDKFTTVARTSNGGISQELLHRIAILEQLMWAEALMLQGQRRLALTMIAEAWVRNPLSTLPARFLLRNLLPQQLVRAIVRAKISIVRSG
jgi:glycosyltransferase involved in cell wall biosynthesis